MNFPLLAWLNKFLPKKKPLQPKRPFNQTAEYYYRLQDKQHEHDIEISPLGEIIYCSPQVTAPIHGIKELPFEDKIAASIHPDETICLFFSDLIEE